MVWIHGGSFSRGSGALGSYYGNPLVAVGDVIVVTLNYRLNLFGFLTTGKCFPQQSRGDFAQGKRSAAVGLI